MKISAILLAVFLMSPTVADAQVEYVSGSFFPAEQEFPELKKINSRESFENPAQLTKVQDGKLFSDVGFQKYARRVYTVGASGSLSIEVVTLLDSRAAYSLLTLLREDQMQTGPPGDAYTGTADGLRFSKKKEWVRITGNGVPSDLMMRVAKSVSNRIGSDKPKLPSLVARIPEAGMDRSTLRYYPGRRAFAAMSGTIAGTTPGENIDFEVVQARYAAGEQAGVLSLLSFPTPEVAEEYYSNISGRRVYGKRSGHLVGVLEGGFAPGDAEKLLNSIEFAYSVRWIYEKEEKPKTAWGIPGGILTTVVKSFVAVVVLGGFSILVGVGIAFLRAYYRRRALRNSLDGQDPDELTRLKLR